MKQLPITPCPLIDTSVIPKRHDTVNTNGYCLITCTVYKERWKRIKSSRNSLETVFYKAVKIETCTNRSP